MATATKVLTDFRDDLMEAGLSAKTIQHHHDNAELFADYLWSYDRISLDNAVGSVGMFLGDWFLRKVALAPSAMKHASVSLKKLFDSMVRDHIDACSTGRKCPHQG